MQKEHSDDNFFQHDDMLSDLNAQLPLRDKLIGAHNALKKTHPFIARIAIALYDPETHLLKTYLHSSGKDMPLKNYQALLDDAPSLKEILHLGKPRVVNNMVTFEDGKQEHTQRIGRQGYAASYTLPMFNNGIFLGFIFYNSYKSDVFDEKTLNELDLYGHLISLMVINEISSLKTLSAAIATTSSFTHFRDPETGSHLDRMSRYSRLIAKALAEKYNLDDEYIEHVFMFSPLHDIGKVAIPDTILLKNGKLSHEEFQIMQRHPRLGREMLDDLVANFGLSNLHHIELLRNIAEYHHEAINGSGYPKGLKRENIPLEARIVAVADVFDALTSKRPYKEAWKNEDAIEMICKLSDEKLDRDCVEALISHMDEVETIQKQFKEDELG